MNKLHNLRFNVAQLLKQPIGATRSYEVETPVGHLAPELEQTEPLMGRVHMLRTGLGVLVEGQFEGMVVTQCSRCLSDVVVPVSVEIEEEFQPTIDVVRGTHLPLEEEDAALLIDEQHILDLSEVLRQSLLLAIPMQPLCMPDCAGLCPVCGQDLNQGTCECVAAEVDPRWQDLGALLAGTDV